MKNWIVKFKSFNREDYCEIVSGKNEKEARKNVNKVLYKRDDRDKIISIEENEEISLSGNW